MEGQLKCAGLRSAIPNVTLQHGREDLKLTSSGEDEQGPYICLEQHRWLDLDDDGYEEPYVVTLVNALGLASDGTRNMEGGDIVRIVPRYFVEDIALNSSNKVVSIRPQQVFSKFDFLPDLCGKLMGTGFGQLLLPINESRKCPSTKE